MCLSEGLGQRRRCRSRLLRLDNTSCDSRFVHGRINLKSLGKHAQFIICTVICADLTLLLSGGSALGRALSMTGYFSCAICHDTFLGEDLGLLHLAICHRSHFGIENRVTCSSNVTTAIVSLIDLITDYLAHSGDVWYRRTTRSMPL